MKLRTRLALVMAVSVAGAVALSAVVVHVATERELVDQVDDGLRARLGGVGAVRRVEPPLLTRLPPAVLGGAASYAQTVDRDGVVRVSAASVAELPVTDLVLEIAAEGGPPTFETVDVSGTRVRTIVAPWTEGSALQLGRPLDEIDDTMRRLRRVLLAVATVAAVVAAAGGWVLARLVLRPVAALTDTTERVARTHDLTERIPVHGDDELARLSRSFNAMLGALEASLQAQRALVADASHELRTPLTSIRTNIAVLGRADDLDAEERARIVADVDAQIADLAALVGDIIELARDGEALVAVDDVRLDDVVDRALDRAAAHWPSVQFVADVAPPVVRGAGDRLARAVDNLLDNAGKWSPAGGTVRVTLRDGLLQVDDEGPGVAESDAPHVFDRFWRAADARRLPGSGLGLAIVAQVAEQHQATVWVERSAAHGASFRMRFPSWAAPAAGSGADGPVAPGTSGT